MDKALRNALIAGIIIIALSVGYYLVVFLPKKEAMRIEQQKQDSIEKAFTKELETKKQNLEVSRVHLECAVSSLNEDGKKQCKEEVDKNTMRDDSNDWGQ